MGKSLETVLNSSWLGRDRMKELALIEFWGSQLYDVLEGLGQIHEDGYVSGSINASHVLFVPNEQPWGVLHAPGIARADSVDKRMLYAQWPYYKEDGKPITI